MRDTIGWLLALARRNAMAVSGTTGRVGTGVSLDGGRTWRGIAAA
jgi:hypothetical protein